MALKQAAIQKSDSVLSLENCGGWITTGRQLGLDEKGVIQGLTGPPTIPAYSAAGREEENIEVLRVLEQAGLRYEQVMHVLQKCPCLLLIGSTSLAQRLARLANMGFPPGSDGGPLLKQPIILTASLQFNVVEWLTVKGFPEPLIRRMILSRPNMLALSPRVLGPMLEYVAWVLGSKEAAVKLLTKQSKMFGLQPTSVHAKLLMLKELAYDAMGRERFPTTNSLEDAIVVCQERWDYEWKAKFDERSLMMQTEWKVSGIAGLPTIGDLMCKGEE
eukprot:gene8270-1539_t